MFQVHKNKMPPTDVKVQDVAYGELDKSEYGVRVKYTSGYSESYENKYEPEELIYDEDNLFAWVEAVKNEDVSAISRTAEIINKEGLITHPKKVLKEELSKAETNQEYCLFKEDGLGNLAKGRKIVLLNPTIGTFSRYLNVTDSGHFEVHSDADDFYFERLKMVASAKNFKGLKRFNGIDSDCFYYLSFGSKFFGHKSIKYYAGWIPNPVSLANLGVLSKVQESSRMYRISYSRSGQLKSFVYHKKPRDYVYSVDFMYDRYVSSKAMRKGMPFAYDFYCDWQCFDDSSVVYESLLYPVGARFLKGNYWMNNNAIYKKKRKVHDLHSHRIGLSGHWLKPDEEGHLARISSFMASEFSSRVVYLGKTHAVKKVDYKTGIYYQGSYYKPIPYDDKESTLVLRKRRDEWVLVPLRPMVFSLQSLLRSEHYSNCTYQTVYGTRYEYVEDAAFQW